MAKKKEPNYSRDTCPLFFLAALVVASASGPPVLVMWLLVVSVVSHAHHSRSYDEPYDDWLRWLDILCAVGLGVLLLAHWGAGVLLYIGPALWIFFTVLLDPMQTTLSRSFWHACMHALVTSGIATHALLRSGCSAATHKNPPVCINTTSVVPECHPLPTHRPMEFSETSRWWPSTST